MLLAASKDKMKFSQLKRQILFIKN